MPATAAISEDSMPSKIRTTSVAPAMYCDRQWQRVKTSTMFQFSVHTTTSPSSSSPLKASACSRAASIASASMPSSANCSA